MKKSVRERIYDKIRDDITYGRFGPGERIVEEKLVARFHASRSPIREALRQLESEGLILFERNRGITVAKLSIKQVDEIYSLRSLLESYATRLVAEKCLEKDLAYLRGLQSSCGAAAKKGNLTEWLHSNMQFHNYFCEHCGNANLTRVLDGLKRRVYRYHYITVSVSGHFESYLKHHEGVLAGCEKNNGEIAEKYMKMHLEKIKRVLIDYLKRVKITY